MRAILNQVGRMREGDYFPSSRPSAGHDEVERLSRAFNELAARLESSEARRRQFVSDASHELKTPLASIKLLSDSILQNEMDPETQREFIGDIGREADRLGRLTQKLLTLTKLDSSVEEEREILDAAPVVRKVVRMLLPLARLRGIGIDTTFEPDCSVMTVEDDLYQIVFNLTENAIKYNRQDGWVGVSVRRAGDQVELRVEDNGAGIPPESMEHIFERFTAWTRHAPAPRAAPGWAFPSCTTWSSAATAPSPCRPGRAAARSSPCGSRILIWRRTKHETPAAFAAPACAAVRLHRRARRAGGRPVFLYYRCAEVAYGGEDGVIRAEAAPLEPDAGLRTVVLQYLKGPPRRSCALPCPQTGRWSPLA